MDKDLLAKFIDLMNSENDADAIMGLRGAQNIFKDIGGSFKNTLLKASDNISPIEVIKSQSSFIKSAGAVQSNSIDDVKKDIVNESGVPEFRILSGGNIEVVLSGDSNGKVYMLTGESVEDISDIKENMKDALVAAIISKCKFKLKLFDIKDDMGDTVETILRAEYEREDVLALKIWGNINRGEVGLLASVLRKILSENFADLSI